MATADLSNYVAIENAVANLIASRWPGIAVAVGDYSKIVESTPCAVVAHGEMQSAVADRMPQFEWVYWQFPIHIFFDYTNDIEAHELFRQYRVDMVNLFQLHRYLDDGNPYPPGKMGQCDDSKLIMGMRPAYITIDGKDYVQSSYELWAAEKLTVIYP